jgi:hypothetical protein
MFHYQCDWCGERINAHRDQYVKASIEIVTHETDRLGREETETEPTRFFHVAPLRSSEEWNRLGLEVRSEEIGDCCYTRALKAIEGRDFDAPDAGMEWRLVPVGARIEADGTVGEPVEPPDPIDSEPLWQSREYGGKSFLGPRGEQDFLSLTRPMFEGTLNAAGFVDAAIETVGDLRRAIGDGSLLRVKGVGPKRAAATKAALEQFLAGMSASDVGDRQKVGG